LPPPQRQAWNRQRWLGWLDEALQKGWLKPNSPRPPQP